MTGQRLGGRHPTFPSAPAQPRRGPSRAASALPTVPRDFDSGVAHPARVYDYWLGGKDNFPADRQAGAEVMAVRPGVAAAACANRAFMHRAARYLAGPPGIRQFLDIGTGVPSYPNSPGVVQPGHWMPDGAVPDSDVSGWAGVARKP